MNNINNDLTGCFITIISLLVVATIGWWIEHTDFKYATDLYCQKQHRADVLKYEQCKKQNLIEMLRKDLQ